MLAPDEIAALQQAKLQRARAASTNSASPSTGLKVPGAAASKLQMDTASSASNRSSSLSSYNQFDMDKVMIPIVNAVNYNICGGKLITNTKKEKKAVDRRYTKFVKAPAVHEKNQPSSPARDRIFRVPGTPSKPSISRQPSTCKLPNGKGRRSKKPDDELSESDELRKVIDAVT